MMAIVVQKVKLKLMAESITLKLVIGKAIFILIQADLKRQSQVKLVNDLNGYKKKNKLDLPGLSPELVSDWIKK